MPPSPRQPKPTRPPCLFYNSPMEACVVVCRTQKPKARRGRRLAAVTKERITIRLSREVVETFRASGDGWQTRVDSALKDWLKTHSPG